MVQSIYQRAAVFNSLFTGASVMIHADWEGFYGPGYRLLLTQRSDSDIDAMAWGAVLALHERNPASEGHWEFLAVGYLHLFGQTEQLSAEMLNRLSLLLPRFQKRPRTCNWRLMARVVKVRLGNRWLKLRDLEVCGLVPTNEGFLPDEPNDSSSQYHAYMLLLIMRFGDTRDEGLHIVVRHALDWLVEVCRQHGDPSPLGRGRFQVFGYAAMAATAGLAHRWSVSNDPHWLSAVWSRCTPELPTGSLSSVWTGPHRTRLLHGYNTTDDYPAFAALWMNGLSRPEPLLADSFRETCSIWWYELDAAGSGILADSTGPIAVLMVDQQQGSVAGLRYVIKALLRSRKSLALEREPIRLEAKECIRCGGFVLTMLDGGFVLQSDPEYLISLLVTASVTLWLPRQAPKPSLSGSCELDQLTWQRAEAPIWYGLKARLVRHGHFQVECSQ
jgi:hypothetical protein